MNYVTENKRRGFVVALIIALTMLLTTTVSFADDTNPAKTKEATVKTWRCPTVPFAMKPGTVIEYVDKENIRIVSGGFIDADYKKWISKQGEYDKPVAGMTVDYCDDTYIGHFKYPEGKNPYQKQYNNVTFCKEGSGASKAELDKLMSASSGAKRAAADTWTQIGSAWGKSNNKIYRPTYATPSTASTRRGTGRATTFTSKTGQAEIANKKGSIATKLNRDDCPVWTKVNLTLAVKGSSTKKTVTMSKTDAGGMPDAIIDIWKTGVEYWGYTYYETLSINNAEYIHG